MTTEQALKQGFAKVYDELLKMRERFLADAKANPQDYEGIDADDAFIWYIEGLS